MFEFWKMPNFCLSSISNGVFALNMQGFSMDSADGGCIMLFIDYIGWELGFLGGVSLLFMVFCFN